MSNLELSKEAKDARNKYHRDWVKKNKDKVKAAKKRYWEKKAQEMKQQEAK